MRVEHIGSATLYPSGEAHYAWQGDAVSEKGGRKRALRLFPEIGHCIKCSAEKAERHHKDGNTANNTPGNIEALCRRCHMEADGRLAEVSRLSVARIAELVAAAAAEKSARTHCKRGHPLSGDNLFTTSQGSRGCKECRKIHKATYLGKINAA